jgi:hypothetical protein
MAEKIRINFQKKIISFELKMKIIRQSLLKFLYSLSSSSLSPLIDGYNSICPNVATFSQICSQLYNSVQTFPLFLHFFAAIFNCV